MLLFTHEIRMKVPHVELNQNSQLDQEFRSKCQKYQAQMKDYHNAKYHAAPHNFNIGDVVFCANNVQFYPAMHVLIKTQGRDTFNIG